MLGISIRVENIAHGRERGRGHSRLNYNNIDERIFIDKNECKKHIKLSILGSKYLQYKTHT